MLTLERVTAGYGDTTVLWDVSLEVRRGEAVALLAGMAWARRRRSSRRWGSTRRARAASRSRPPRSRDGNPSPIARLGIG